MMARPPHPLRDARRRRPGSTLTRGLGAAALDLVTPVLQHIDVNALIDRLDVQRIVDRLLRRSPSGEAALP
jgi:hypothetical protein